MTNTNSEQDLNYGPVTLIYANGSPIIKDGSAPAMLQMEEFSSNSEMLDRARKLQKDNKLFLPSVKAKTGAEIWNSPQLLQRLRSA